jgi:hypothetical protein
MHIQKRNAMNIQTRRSPAEYSAAAHSAAAHIDPAIPLVVICNYLELFSDFLDHIGDPNLIRSRQFADRDLFWLGDPKLVITATPLENMSPLLNRWGYPGTRTLMPCEITPQLCLDTLRDANALRQIADYAGQGRMLQMVPYVTTPEFFQLVDALRSAYGLTIHLPESCEPHNLWVRNAVDTKIGFRMLACQWLNGTASLPEGYFSNSLSEAAQIASWFTSQGRSCVVKYNQGGGGVGNCFMYSEEQLSLAQIRARLEHNNGLYNQPGVIEAYIAPHRQLSPSIELFVPPLSAGAPKITYVCNQMFEETGIFSGIMINKELYRTSWYPQLASAGLCIAENLQQLGYVGFFDLDSVLDQEENLYLLEINSRRTGGTFVDEFARHMIGEDYQDRVVLFSSSSICSGSAATPADLLDYLSDLLYPMDGEHYGIIITSISTLPEGKFGALLIAPTGEQLACLWSTMNKKLCAHEFSYLKVPVLIDCSD